MATVTVQTVPEPEIAFTEGTTDHKPTGIDKFATNDKTVSRRRLRIAVIAILGVSLFLQFIALTTPGWAIVWYEGSVLDGYSSHRGMFYSTTCVSDDLDIMDLLNDDEDEDVNDEEEEEEKSVTCKTFSYMDSFMDSFDGASDSKSLDLKRVYSLGQGRQQAGVSLSWMGTLLSLLAIGYTLLTKRDLINAGFILGCGLSVIGIIMGEVIFVTLVELDYLNGSKKLAKGMNVGFPYSLFFYILAFIQIVVSCVVVFKCFRDDIAALSQTLSEHEVILDTEKKHVEHLRDKLHRDSYRPSPRGSPRLHGKYPRELRPSPRGSPRVSRELSPSPRPSPRPRDHQKFFPQDTSPRNSAEIRDYDRHSPRPPRDSDYRSRDRHNGNNPRDHDRHSDRPRDHRDDRPRRHRDDRPRDPRDDRPRDHKDDRPREYRDGRPREYRDERRRNHRDERPRDHRDDRYRNDENPRDRRDDRPRDHHDERPRVDVEEKQTRSTSGGGSQENNELRLEVPNNTASDNQPEDDSDDHCRYPSGTLGDYRPVPDSSDSEAPTNNASSDVRGAAKTDTDTTTEEKTTGVVDVKDISNLTIDV